MINLLLHRLLYFVNGSCEFSGPPWNVSEPCPTAIVARPHRGPDCIKNPNGWDCRFPNMTVAHSALVHCPNVETLEVHLDVGGCEGSVRDLSAFPFASGDTYPPLKSLRLDGYKFGGLEIIEQEQDFHSVGCVGPARKSEWDKTWMWDNDNEWNAETNTRLLQEWEKQGGKPKTNLDMWLEAMDWSQLEELSIDTRRSAMLDAITELPKRLTSLKHLHLNILPFIEGLKNQTLETLHWIGPTHSGALSTILSQQSQTLKTLEYRCDEFTCPHWPDHIPLPLPPLSNLTHLTVNLPRNPNATWPLAHLSSLAQIPSLESLTLYFRMQRPCKENIMHNSHPSCFPFPSCYEPESFETPYLNASTARYMFSYLRSENESKNLTAVTFKTGDWQGLNMMIEPFIAHRQAVVECRVRKGLRCVRRRMRGIGGVSWGGCGRRRRGKGGDDV
ncbi:hypothetical protein N0V86_009398 [Didymella sp. IMI 355093]|nr:hypothetical protein N0V86_009398 [Didymella sp. IMI 355093]